MSVPESERETMYVPELAKLLGVGRDAVYKAAREKGAVAGVPAIVIGRRVVFSRQQVRRMLAGEPVHQLTRAAS